MRTLTITAADLDESGFYIGTTDVTDFDGHIEIAADLGLVRFPTFIRAKGRIIALAGLGIRAGLGIDAKFISAGLRIFAGLCLHHMPTTEETQIHAEIRSGVVAFGEVVAPDTAIAGGHR